MPVRPGSREGGLAAVAWGENPERWQGEHVTVASVSQRCRKCRIFPSWFGRYISYVRSCCLSARMMLFPFSDGDFSYRSEKKFLEGEGDARGRGGPFSKKGFPPPACPASFRNTCYFLFENIS